MCFSSHGRDEPAIGRPYEVSPGIAGIGKAEKPTAEDLESDSEKQPGNPGNIENPNPGNLGFGIGMYIMRFSVLRQHCQLLLSRRQRSLRQEVRVQ